MAANELSQLLGGRLFGNQAGDIPTVFLRFLDDLALAQLFAIAPHGDELPTAGQPGLLGIDRNALKSPALQAPMFLAPARIVFRGKKSAGTT